MISLTSPVRTRAHDWPAGAKLAGLCLATVTLFAIRDPVVLAIVVCGVAGLYALPGPRFFRSGLRHLRLIWPFVVIVALWHLWTAEIASGLVIILRMVAALGLANLVTMTTRLSDMIDVVKWLTRPLRALGLRAEVLELAIALVIRMTPVLVDKGQQLGQAWRARSVRRPGWRIVLPFTLLALDDAEQVSEALKARGGLTRKTET